jgi:hypothetical protein
LYARSYRYLTVHLTQSAGTACCLHASNTFYTAGGDVSLCSSRYNITPGPCFMQCMK